MCLGIVGFVMGVGLLGAFWYFDNHRFLAIGIVYILAAGAIFGIRGAIAKIHEIRRHEYEGE